jgi:UDP-3-O-[3-hydroxymyristoyl] glucosamine N-acyltransferase
MKKTVGELAGIIGGRVIGNEAIEITGVASLETAHEGTISFVDSEKNLARSLQSKASCLIVPDDCTTEAKTIIQVKHPRLGFAKIVEAFFPKTRPAPGVHPTAIIGQGVAIGEGATVGPYVVLESGVHIGGRTIIGAGVFIGERSVIGDDSTVHPNVTIYHDVLVGSRVTIHAGSVLGGDGFGYFLIEGKYHKFPQVGKVVIEDDVEIGTNVSIDRGTLGATLIKRGTKIDNLVQVAHNVVIGEDTVIAAQTGIAGSSQVERQVVIGGQVGIADHVRIGQGAILGAQAGIPTGKRIRAGEFVWGTPARPMSEFKEHYANVARLPKLKQEVERLKQVVAELEARLGGRE